MPKEILSYFNLSDRYERKARLLPALLTLLLLTPPLLALKLPVSDWIATLLGGGGLSAVVAVAISHLSSAFGNRIQHRIWPQWPNDSPTNLWLHPDDDSRSVQQKNLWYTAIERLTGLSIESAIASGSPREISAVINDAVANIRNQLWSSKISKRLKVHNEDFGFARNLTGLRWVWVVFAMASAISCWVLFYISRGELIWAIVSTAVLLLAVFLGFLILPEYVKQKAAHYSESFFSALIELDASSQK